MKTDLMNIIFGMKVKRARTDMGMSLSAFAKACRLSASYLTEIEKGRKYPKRDKIMQISEVTGIDYDELVSIRLAPSLQYLESALTSPLISDFPLEEFGVEMGTVVELLTNAPTKVSALIHAIFDVAQRYDMKEEHFLRAALRSLQEMNDNHFVELEDSAEATVDQYNLTVPLDCRELERILIEEHNYIIDHTTLAQDKALSTFRSVVVKGKQHRLLLNPNLTEGQVTFQMAREIGHRVLGLKERAYTSPPQVVESFDQVFNDFKASYLAGAMMMPREEILADIEALFAQETFQPERMTRMLTKYDVTPEMLCYRFSELVPQYFGIDLHFLRFDNRNDRYRLIKQLKMNNLPLPHGFGLKEHYCRRWLTVRLLREIEGNPPPTNKPHIGVQMSEFLNRDNSRFLCIGFSRQLALTPNVNTSVNIGFRVTPDLYKTIKFADDPAIPQTVIHDACERCPLTLDQCNLRAAPPILYEREQQREERQAALRTLQGSLRG